MEIIPPELMNDEKPQIDRNHSKRGAIRKITLLDINYVKIQEYQRYGKIVKNKTKHKKHQKT